MKRRYCRLCKSRVKKVDSVVKSRSPVNTSYSWFKAFSNRSTIDLVENDFYKCKKCNKILKHYEVVPK